MTMHPRLERKDADGGISPALQAKFAELMTTVTAFQAKNDQHIAEMKSKKVDDVVLKEHVDRINAAIDTKLDELKKATEAEVLEIKRSARNAGGNGEQKSAERVQYEKDFRTWFRKGGDAVSGGEYALRELESKALSVGSDPDGGFTALPEIDQAIDATIKIVSPMRQVASVRQIGGASYRRFINVHGTASGWVGETDPRTATGTPQLKAVDIPAMEMYALATASQSLLDDSFLNIDTWLADEVNLEFAQKEAIGFISGNGVMQPRGFLTETIGAYTAAEAYGTIYYVATGTSAGFTPVSTGPVVQGADCLFDVIYSLKPGYRAGAQWLMNRRTAAVVRKLKDLYGNYLWQPGIVSGQPATLNGYPVVDTEDMPDIAANSYSIAFGDWKRAYTIVDRMGTRVLRDPYTSKPNVLFYVTKRVGGKTTMHEAIKLLKFGTS